MADLDHSFREGMSLKDLSTILASGLDEHRRCEFKHSRALNRDEEIKAEISKDVSSFANADGGFVFYGVDQPKGKPAEIDTEGIDSGYYSVEWLDNILASHIDPPIKDIRIVSIDHPNPGRLIYVVCVPKSKEAPHQAHDHRYYSRLNKTRRPLEAFEVRGLYFQNILHQSEFRKLQEQVRQTIYKPIFQDLLHLEERLKIEAYPYRIETGLSHANPYLPMAQFAHWNSLKRSGNVFDLHGYGDEETPKMLDRLMDKIEDYNQYFAPIYSKMAEFVFNLTGSPDQWTSDAWEDLREALIQNNQSLGRWEQGIRQLKSPLLSRFRDLEDNEVYGIVERDFNAKYSKECSKLRDYSNLILGEVENCMELISEKIKAAY